jgi:phage host-nuclease inhibitor protein Gam
MADDLSSEIQTEVEIVPAPTTKREAGSLMAKLGHRLLSTLRSDARDTRRIAKFRQKANRLEKERKERYETNLEELGTLGSLLASFSFKNWIALHTKGTRLIRYGTGEVRLRDVGKPTIRVKDVGKFYEYVRKHGKARTFMRHPPPEPDLEALRKDPDFAKKCPFVEWSEDTKIELRPKHTDEYLMAVVLEEKPLVWEIGPEKKKK